MAFGKREYSAHILFSRRSVANWSLSFLLIFCEAMRIYQLLSRGIFFLIFLSSGNKKFRLPTFATSMAVSNSWYMAKSKKVGFLYLKI